jgi:hypothetical protein
MVSDTYHQVPTGFGTAGEAPVRKKSKEEREAAYQKELELAKLKSEEALRIAKIEAEAKEKIKQIEIEATKAKVAAAKEVHLQEQKTQKEIAATKEKRIIQTKEKDIFLYLIIAGVVALLILIGLLVWYLVYRRNKEAELKMHEEKLRHEAMMEASRQHHEKVGRVLDIIADESADQQVRHKLIGVLGDQMPVQQQITYEPEVSEGEDTDVVEDEDMTPEEDAKKDIPDSEK